MHIELGKTSTLSKKSFGVRHPSAGPSTDHKRHTARVFLMHIDSPKLVASVAWNFCLSRIYMGHCCRPDEGGYPRLRIGAEGPKHWPVRPAAWLPGSGS